MRLKSTTQSGSIMVEAAVSALLLFTAFGVLFTNPALYDFMLGRGEDFNLQSQILEMSETASIPQDIVVYHQESNTAPGSFFPVGTFGLAETPEPFTGAFASGYYAWTHVLESRIKFAQKRYEKRSDVSNASNVCGAFLLRRRDGGVLLNEFGDDQFMSIICRSGGETTPATCSSEANAHPGCDPSKSYCVFFCSWAASNAPNVYPELQLLTAF